MTTTVVLVHGAWHGGWCFDRVLPLLRDAGVSAIAVDLPGHGADDRPVGGLAGDVAHVRKVLDVLDGEVVLLGHSYGGAVITEAGTHPAVRHLVYLCAFALDLTESCGNAAADDPAAASISHAGRPNLAHAFVLHDDGTVTLTPEGATECLYQDCDPDTVRWALDRLGPQTLASLADTPNEVGWRDKPSTYVVCTQDMAVHPDLQRILARRCTESVEWDSSHSPFASDPARVADLLVSLAARE